MEEHCISAVTSLVLGAPPQSVHLHRVLAKFVKHEFQQWLLDNNIQRQLDQIKTN